MIRQTIAALLLSAAVSIPAAIPSAMPASADGTAKDAVARGKYLVTVISCGDCHTPGHLLGKPDMARMLGGSDVGFEIPGLGVFHGSNLTPDMETGIGGWTEEQIVTAIRTGKRPDGRMLAPSMPWMSFAALSDEDAHAIASYLKTLSPVANKVPGPFGATDKPTGLVMRISAPQ